MSLRQDKNSVIRKNKEDPILRRYEVNFGALRDELAALGYFFKGTILARMVKCGKAGCACQKDLAGRHGPYFELTYKRAGKTINVRLHPEHVQIYRDSTAQWCRLRKLLQRMEGISRQAIARKAQP